MKSHEIKYIKKLNEYQMKNITAAPQIEVIINAMK